MDTREVIIIGSGPAGLTAAIYTARANLHPLVIEGIGAGGQLMLTTDVENYPGFPDGILGPELMAQFREQAERFGAEFVTADVDRVDLASDPKRVWVGGDRVLGAHGHHLDRRAGADARPRLRARAARPRRLHVRDLRRLLLPRPRDRGRRRRRLRARGGDVPHPVRRQGHARAPPQGAARARRSCRTARSRTRRSSSAGTASSTTSRATASVEALRAPRHRDRRDQRARGHRPVRRDRPRSRTPRCSRASSTSTTDGYIVTEPGSTQTSVPGVFAGGDVQDHIYRQAITAAGSGCMAALEAERYLEALGDRSIAG